jgi:uncharacterized membrane protein YtjA (UPF0391 family)
LQSQATTGFRGGIHVAAAHPRTPERAYQGAPGKETIMLSWALMFFVVALIAMVLGLRGVAGLSAEIGYVLVVVALIFVAISFFVGRAPPVP